jgi:DNA-binding XRE family transcriptional regulator
VDVTAPFRGREHTVRSKVHQCRHCDAIATSPEQAEVISNLVRDSHRQWISSEFKKARKELGFTIDSLTKATGLSRPTIARASSGATLIEASLEELLWLKIGRMRERRQEAWMAGIASGTMRPHTETESMVVSITTSTSAIFAAARKVVRPISPLDVFRREESSDEEFHTEHKALYA